jgi:menaquinol-cytochrome c reductase iron-sulfur subunit
MGAMSEDKDNKPSDPSRRGTLGTLVVVGSAAYAGALAVPGYAFVAGESGKGPSGERWLRVAEVKSLVDGSPTRVKVQGDMRDAFTVTKNMTLGSVWMLRTGDTVRVLTAECPHLGCAVSLEADHKAFTCPCHTSKFSLDGKAESGPSPRAMDELASRVKDGWLEVNFQRFRQGVTDKVEV